MAALYLVVHFLVALGSAGGLVLCFGGDGHVSVESAPTGFRFGPLSSATSQAVGRPSSAKAGAPADNPCEKHRGSCVDIPILIGDPDHCIAPKVNSGTEVKTRVPATRSSLVPITGKMVRGDCPADLLSTNNSRLTSPSTVVLLI